MAKYVDDQFDHLESDIDKIRVRHRQYISYSNEAGAKSVVDEILYNALDECKTPRSPGNKITVEFDEKSGFITVRDNGRGIPTDLLEKIFTSLNMGSNINTKRKASLKTETLGQNGTGTLAICGLAEHVEITSYRGGTENKYKLLVFEEGKKVHEEDGKCSEGTHGMLIRYKPSKVMGKNTRIIWKDVEKGLENLQYLNKKKILMTSDYIIKENEHEYREYKTRPFDEILLRNGKENIISNRYFIVIDDAEIIEELDGETVKRFLSFDLAFTYVNVLNPYIDSFSNSNNTVDNGDHLDGAIEAVCRYLQKMTKNSMSEKEREKLDIKWDDVKAGLSIAVAMRTNYESLYTGQTKHKVVSAEIKQIIINLLMEQLGLYFEKNPSQLKELIAIVKMNAKIRREGDKLKTAVVKSTLNHWASYKIKNYDPCTRKGLREYKEIFIIEGDSAKGSLKKARNPLFQALFAIRGVSANVYKRSIDQIVGPNGNKEFNNLVTVMGCNVGLKFDLSKLQFNKIIIASDADIDGLFIRSLLLAFFFKMFPEIIEDGRLFIAEPPLYKIDDKKNPFVINKEDYINRYVIAALKDYKIGYFDEKNHTIDYLDKKDLTEFLTDTNAYVKTIRSLSKHYKVNDRLLEIIMEEFSMMNYDPVRVVYISLIKSLDIQHLMNRIGMEFTEIHYNDKDKTIIGTIDAVMQMLEIDEAFIRKSIGTINVMKKWRTGYSKMILRDNKTHVEHQLSMLEMLKMLEKYQPNIIHRFKGLGENSDEDIKTTIMDPNTRTLIRVNIGDIENDMKVFQMLRGDSPLDARLRKEMMANYKIPRDLIDT